MPARRGRHTHAPDRCIADRRCAPCSRWSDPVDLFKLPQQCGLRTLVGGPPAVGAVGSGIADAIESLRGIAAGCRGPPALSFLLSGLLPHVARSAPRCRCQPRSPCLPRLSDGGRGDALVEMGHDLAAGRNAGTLDQIAHRILEERLTALTLIEAGCERIAGTPFPLPTRCSCTGPPICSA